jgi:hypothetical protein
VIAAGVVVWYVSQERAKRRTTGLRNRFGTEYDRVVGSSESKGEAESELERREERREELDVRPLPEASRARYLESWREVQAQFVDDPRGAVGSADSLLQLVLRERGYPVEDFEQRAADVSVDHPDVVQNYREGHRLSQASKGNGTSTEDLRRAMQHYRALFEELVEEPDTERVS